MKKVSIVFVFLFYIFTSAFSQQNSFVFKLDCFKDSIKRIYKSLVVADCRVDTSTIGFVKKGLVPKLIPISFNGSFPKQLENAFNTDKTKLENTDTLLLSIRQFQIWVANAVGYIKFKGDLFTLNNHLCTHLQYIDTLVKVDAVDFTDATLKEGCNTLYSIVTSAKDKDNCVNCYQIDKSLIYSIDSVEKNFYPLYKNATLTNGAYKTWEAFLKQQPDDTSINIEYYKKTGNWKSIQLRNKKGKHEEVELKKWYSFVHNNNIFISTSTGIYKMYKKNNNFCFKGKIKTRPNAGQVITTGFLFGLVGILIFNSTYVEDGELAIDYKTGSFFATEQR